MTSFYVMARITNLAINVLVVGTPFININKYDIYLLTSLFTEILLIITSHLLDNNCLSTIYEDIKNSRKCLNKALQQTNFCNLKKTELSHFIKVEAIKFLSLTGGKWEPVISLLAAAPPTLALAAGAGAPDSNAALTNDHPSPEEWAF